MSEATSPVVAVRPMTIGEVRLATTIASGSTSATMARAKSPRKIAIERRTASRSPCPAASSASTRCAITSVSVSEASTWPFATRAAASSRWFSMIPLCTMATFPVQSTCGWALRSVGAPCVAQRVCPIAAPAETGASATIERSFSTERVSSATRTTRSSLDPASAKATPAES